MFAICVVGVGCGVVAIAGVAYVAGVDVVAVVTSTC